MYRFKTTYDGLYDSGVAFRAQGLGSVNTGALIFKIGFKG